MTKWHQFFQNLYIMDQNKGEIIKINQKKIKIDDEKRKNIYFCPHCKEINKAAIDESQATIFVQSKNGKKYRCKVCEPRTNLFNPLDDKTWKGLSYNFRVKKETKVREVDPLIKEVIDRLQAKGFSNRDIHAITHFSRQKINELSSTILEEPSESYSLKQFLEDKLVVSANVLEKLLNNGVLSDIEKTEFVTKALLYGCTYDCIVQVIGISKGAISKVVKTLYCDRLEIEINKINRKIVLVDDGLEKRVSIKTREKK